MQRTNRRPSDAPAATFGPYPWRARGNTAPSARDTSKPGGVEVLAALDSVSRRMKDLARSLDCLGYFDDEGDRPRAA